LSDDKVTKSVAEAIAAQRAAPSLPKRFYKQVSCEARGDGFAVLLDGRALCTPGKAELRLPGAPLAEQVRIEWEAQEKQIDLTTMPMTRLAYKAIDAVKGREAEIRADIVNYAGSDLLCYRADHPDELIERQARIWDPVLAWAAHDHGIGLILASGVSPVRQSDTALAAFKAKIETGYDNAFALGALHVMTTLSGSALLAFAHAQGRLSLEQAWHAAHVDEDWQIEKWGADDEAMKARAARKADMNAASQMLDLLYDKD